MYDDKSNDRRSNNTNYQSFRDEIEKRSAANPFALSVDGHLPYSLAKDLFSDLRDKFKVYMSEIDSTNNDNGIYINSRNEIVLCLGNHDTGICTKRLLIIDPDLKNHQVFSELRYYIKSKHTHAFRQRIVQLRESSKPYDILIADAMEGVSASLQGDRYETNRIKFRSHTILLGSSSKESKAANPAATASEPDFAKTKAELAEIKKQIKSLGLQYRDAGEDNESADLILNDVYSAVEKSLPADLNVFPEKAIKILETVYSLISDAHRRGGMQITASLAIAALKDRILDLHLNQLVKNMESSPAEHLPQALKTLGNLQKLYNPDRLLDQILTENSTQKVPHDIEGNIIRLHLKAQLCCRKLSSKYSDPMGINSLITRDSARFYQACDKLYST